MDPNVTLSLIRSHIHAAAEHLREQTPEGDTGALQAFVSASENFEELDVWLQTGGFIPVDWL